MTQEALRYPIGHFSNPEEITLEILETYISDISTFPESLQKEVENLTNEQLDTPYRDGGWTVRQVVNHCADSHMNSLTRFKLALTEENPTIKPYREDLWAELADSKNLPIEPAMLMLKGIHNRLTILLKGMTTEELKRTFKHPDQAKEFRLDETIGMYAWHCNHHLAHIKSLKSRRNWK